jgi:hypothetical protein
LSFLACNRYQYFGKTMRNEMESYLSGLPREYCVEEQADLRHEVTTMIVEYSGRSVPEKCELPSLVWAGYVGTPSTVTLLGLFSAIPECCPCQ